MKIHLALVLTVLFGCGIEEDPNWTFREWGKLFGGTSGGSTDEPGPAQPPTHCLLCSPEPGVDPFPTNPDIYEREIYSGYDMTGEQRTCQADNRYSCLSIFGMDTQFKIDCVEAGFEDFRCGCQDTLCSEPLNPREAGSVSVTLDLTRLPKPVEGDVRIRLYKQSPQSTVQLAEMQDRPGNEVYVLDYQDVDAEVASWEHPYFLKVDVTLDGDEIACTNEAVLDPIESPLVMFGGLPMQLHFSMIPGLSNCNVD